MAGQKIKDDATTVNMVTQFATCEQETLTAGKLASGAHDQLMAQWGGVAAKKYDAAMQDWMKALNDVKSALSMIHEAMVTYSSVTTTTEDDNAVKAGSWAFGGQQ